MSVMPILSGLSIVSSLFGNEEDVQNVRDCDGIRLHVGDIVVEAVMTGSGVACPKMSAKPETFRVEYYGWDLLASARLGEMTDTHLMFTILGIYELLGDVSEFVLVRSELSGSYVLFHMAELAWVRDFDDFEDIDPFAL